MKHGLLQHDFPIIVALALYGHEDRSAIHTQLGGDDDFMLFDSTTDNAKEIWQRPIKQLMNSKFRIGERLMIKKLALYLTCFLLSLLVWQDQVTAQEISTCPVALVDHPIIGKTCPRVGRMGNVKLAVPWHYILGPVTYKGVDIWNTGSFKNRPKSPTFDNEIENFAIRLRLNNFRPIESLKDQDDARSLGKINGWKQPPENRWIHIGFYFYDVQISGFMKREQLRNWLKKDFSRGPFELQPTLIWGLQHYVSVQKPSTQNDQYEIFYDPQAEDTFIYCANRLIAVPPHEPITNCQIDFLIRELKLSVHVDRINFKEDLARWGQIEQGIRQVISLSLCLEFHTSVIGIRHIFIFQN